MTAPLTVLHLTAHLGGGIGKALSGLILGTPPDSGICHEIVCLELPEKSQFVDKLSGAGCPVIIRPSPETLSDRIRNADIVQLEWWGHPAIPAALCRRSLPPMRLLVWCHVSGLYTPVIPQKLMMAAHSCVFTSPCSLKSVETSTLPLKTVKRLGVIYSCGGFDDLTAPMRSPCESLRAGMIGSLNFAKLHPHFVEFLSAVSLRGFTVRLVGDMVNREILEEQSRRANRPDILEFRGYVTDIARELSEINVFPYILNPLHYGTTENALLEAMAMGVVPIVLDNPAEKCLVDDNITGLIVGNPRQFANAIEWLADNPAERARLSMNAQTMVRRRFTASRMTDAFAVQYDAIKSADKSVVRFGDIFGCTPSEWFLSIQRTPGYFTDALTDCVIDEFALPGMLEKTKGSIFHYRNLFPADTRFSRWINRLDVLALHSKGPQIQQPPVHS